MTGLYLHIPFCKSRCIYCGFYSTTLTSLRQQYTDSLVREMMIRSRRAGEQAVRIGTIYLGGGTPSQLTPSQLRQLFDGIYSIYDVSTDAEVTIECNPDDVTEEFCQCLAGLPVNRVSMGAQTFNNKRLRFLHRRHNAEDVVSAVTHLRKAGISNISIDLMFGFPGETLPEWQTDIDAAINLDVEHISAYCLMYEEGTKLYELTSHSPHSPEEKGHTSIQPVSDELEWQMYELLIDSLAKAGFEHYEISNFARKGSGHHGTYRSRHNSSYWRGIPYIGIGAAAHSYDIHCRQWNVSDIHEYIDCIEQGTVPCEQEVLDEDTRYNDLITTALRMREGICLADLDERYRNYLLTNAQPSLQHGLLRTDGNCIHLTRQGLFVSDDVMSDLIMV